jgi:thiol-disulfide isomerase/thioredoxin
MPPVASPKPAADHALVVACLCAGWCNTCTAYQAVMAELAAARPQLRFVWIDIEDDADALGDDALDVENFPTVMLLRGGRALFYGTLLPHATTLARLLDAQAANALAPGAAASVPASMAAAVWALAPQRSIKS